MSKEELIKNEGDIEEVFLHNHSSILFIDDKFQVVELDERRLKFLKMEEESWCLKSWAIWISQGDQNTICFHRYASQRKSINTIYEIRSPQGNMVNALSEKTQAAGEHFQGLFKELEGCPIAEILEVLDLFPREIT